MVRNRGWQRASPYFIMGTHNNELKGKRMGRVAISDITGQRFKQNWLFHLLLSVLVFTAIGYSSTTLAAGQLMISPTRVVFEERERHHQVHVINNGTSSGTYRIMFERKRMTEEGGFEEVPMDAPGTYSDQMIRYSPRQMTLAPGQSQVVRLLLRKPGNLETGEYRSHLLFQAIPDDTGSRIEQQVQENPDTLTVRITPMLGISIPVIVRSGKTEVQTRISDVELNLPQEGLGRPPAVSFVLHRSGNQSAYGDFSVNYYPPGEDEALLLGLLKGVAIYTPNERRQVAVPLNLPEEVNLSGGSLEIVYNRSDEAGGGELASARISVDTK